MFSSQRPQKRWSPDPLLCAAAPSWGQRWSPADSLHVGVKQAPCWGLLTSGRAPRAQGAAVLTQGGTQVPTGPLSSLIPGRVGAPEVLTPLSPPFILCCSCRWGSRLCSQWSPQVPAGGAGEQSRSSLHPLLQPHCCGVRWRPARRWGNPCRCVVWL